MPFPLIVNELTLKYLRDLYCFYYDFRFGTSVLLMPNLIVSIKNVFKSLLVRFDSLLYGSVLL